MHGGGRLSSDVFHHPHPHSCLFVCQFICWFAGGLHKNYWLDLRKTWIENRSQPRTGLSEQIQVKGRFEEFFYLSFFNTRLFLVVTMMMMINKFTSWHNFLITQHVKKMSVVPITVYYMRFLQCVVQDDSNNENEEKNKLIHRNSTQNDPRLSQTTAQYQLLHVPISSFKWWLRGHLRDVMLNNIFHKQTAVS